MPAALIVDDHRSTVSSLGELVRGEGFQVNVAGTLEEARQQLSREDVDVILLDLNLPDGDGLELLDDVNSDLAPAVVLITGEGSLKSAIEALRRGVTDYLTKPVDITRLKTILSDVASTSGLGRELRQLTNDAEASGRFGRIIGTSRDSREMFRLIARVAPSAASILITGESGTGKEVVARTIHDFSRRRNGPFVAINCGAIAPTLMESELFGHERGAFTGAERRHRGIFERAHRGTLLLDEITEMPVGLQVKLLRVLEAGVVRRVGSEDTVPVDVRVLAATNRPPEEAVAEGRLRRDLFYRLKVFQLDIKPLRKRPDDIEPLVAHFLAELVETEAQTKRISTEAVTALKAYSWPGNVRELRNALHGAFVMADDVITPACLPREIVAPGPAVLEATDTVTIQVGTPLAEAEKALILATLQMLDGNKTRTAQRLGISLKTLYARLAAYKKEADPDA